MSGIPVRAAVLRELGGALSVEEIRLPEPGPGQVRVRLAAVGVCHSDLSLSDGTLRPPKLPVVLGHEGAGIVAALGDDVTDLAVGDHVVLNWAPPCRTCWHCRRGEPYLCEHAMDGAARPYGRLADGAAVYPGLGTAAFATETVVSRAGCIPIPADVPLEHAALLGCAVLTGVGAALHAAAVQPGESVLVIGLGGVGLSAVQGARLAGAGTIIAVDPAPAKLELARRLGATDILEPSPDLPKRVRALADGRGVDHAIECVGRAATIRAAWSATRRGGRTTIVGLGPATDTVTFNALEIAHFARTLAGCMYGNTDPETDLPLLLDHYRAGRLDLATLVTNKIPLDDVGSAFDHLRTGHGARTLILFDPPP
jgi:S-(hydroxymethyl)glutathione dehydrogenase/alcohol dehydrogenase